MGLLDVLLAILIILASALCAYLIFTLKNVNKNLDILQQNLTDLNDRLIPILDNLQEVSDKATQLVEEVELQINKVQNFVTSTKTKITSIGNKSNGKPENRIQNFISNLSAVSKAVTAFINELKK